jgi:hypothetical protein
VAGKLKKVGFGLAIGCIGLPILIGLFVGVTLLTAKFKYEKEGPPRPETTRIAVPLLEDEAPGGRRRRAGGPVAPGKDLPELGVDYAAQARPLRLTIDLEEGVFEIRPGPPGSAVSAEGFFDPKDYELTQHVEEGGDLGREVTIRFRRVRSFLALLFRGMEDNENKIVVTIPRGVPTALALRLRKGESDAELGGLMLTDLQVEMAMGEHTIDFSRPIQGKIANAHFSGSMGEMDLLGLGNARLENAFFRASMGEMKIDFGGDWPDRFSSKAQVRFKMGDARVRIPRGVRILPSSSARTFLGGLHDRALHEDQTDDPDAPTLELDLSNSMSELVVSRD